MSKMDCERTINGYEIGTPLGSGLQGKVKLGVHTATGEVVASPQLELRADCRAETLNLAVLAPAMRGV